MKTGLPPTLPPTQRGHPGKHVHTHTALTHTYALSPICTVGSWMYIVVGTCVRTSSRTQYMLHIYTETPSLYGPNRMGTISSLRAVFKVVGQAGGLLCVCVFTPTEGQ